MRTSLAIVWTGLALTLAGCGQKEEVSADAEETSKGRYAGVGVVRADDLWTKMVTAYASKDPAAATIDDDAQIIIVVDSRTGEVRQCGNHSGYCVSSNPWAKVMVASQQLPVSLTKHAADIRREAEIVPVPVKRTKHHRNQ